LDDKQSNKCDICVKSKIIKKTCHSIECRTQCLSFIYTERANLKQTMSKGGKSYSVTFLDDFSRYTNVYLNKHKDEPFDIFLIYRAKV